MDILERFNSIFFATAKFSTKCDGQLLLQSATRFTLFFFYKNISYKNIEAESYEILRIF